MYSVLIQNQKTIQVFQDYYPLFLELISEGRLGMCRWVESGRTIDTALPGLMDLVEDKEEWRAIVVRLEDENDMSRYKSVPGNSYDFFANRRLRIEDEDNNVRYRIEEAKVPLVRLTNMLGEVPAPEPYFVEEPYKEDGKAPRLIYRPEKNEKDEKAYRELVEKYEFDGKKPVDIVLITLCNVRPKTEKSKTEDVWTVKKEIDSSNFCRENGYSGNTRFVQYPYIKEGRIRKRADLFNFWTCVMLLASDDIDPSSFQAYRLYNIHAEFNREVLGECLQSKYDELKGCKVYVENEMRLALEKKANEKHPAPDYRMSIPAKIDIPKDTNVTVDTEVFRLFPKSTQSDMNQWEGLRSIAEFNLENIFRKQDRVLDECTVKMRENGSMDYDEVTPMDKYEKADMYAELSHIYDDIVKTQNKLSDTRNFNSERITGVSRSIREDIRCRLTKSVALLIGAGVILFTLGFFLSAMPFARPLDRRYVGGVVMFMAFSLGVSILCELFMLIYQKRKLVKLVDQYNEYMGENLNVLTSDMSIFSRFVSNIVSFSRGKSFLNILRFKKFSLETEYDQLHRHLSEITVMTDHVTKWAEAHYVPVTENRNIEDEFMMNYEIPPRDNRLYTFDHGKEYEIPLNYSGETVKSPFGFIDRLIITREEIYDK